MDPMHPHPKQPRSWWAIIRNGVVALVTLRAWAFIAGEVQLMRKFIAYDGVVDRYFVSSPNRGELLVVVGLLGLLGLLMLGFEVRDGLRARPRPILESNWLYWIWVVLLIIIGCIVVSNVKWIAV